MYSSLISIRVPLSSRYGESQTALLRSFWWRGKEREREREENWVGGSCSYYRSPLNFLREIASLQVSALAPMR